MIRDPRSLPPFPYTTLFRSVLNAIFCGAVSGADGSLSRTRARDPETTRASVGRELRMASSLEWRRYYEEDARRLLAIPWHVGPDLTPDEAADIAQSLKEFQAGESSEGK